MKKKLLSKKIGFSEEGEKQKQKLSSFRSRVAHVNEQSGFTLIEVVVVAAIFGILTTILVFNYGDFTDRILATNEAYKIALTTHQAQVFGLGVRSNQGEAFGSSGFTNDYGIFITLPGGDPTNRFIFFLDKNSNGQCDATGSGNCTCVPGDECLTQELLERNIKIESLKAKAGSGGGGGCQDVEELSVTFKRPNPDAHIKKHGSNTVYEFAEVGIYAPRSDELRYVIIRNTGQISVQGEPTCS